MDNLATETATAPAGHSAEVPGEIWAARFKARIVERLTTGQTTWTKEGAELAAESEYEATATYDALTGFENDPEGSADEALSYWEDGA